MPGRGPDRWSFTFGPETLLPQVYYEWELAAAGYAGVWAQENTRAAIFDALRRRETFATSGPRIALRFFVGTDFPEDLLERDDWVAAAYRHGHPMGADIELDADETPRFVVEARKDPQGADLERVQIVKGWLDKDGETHEAVYELTPSRESAAGRIRGYWRDPAYVPGELAFYYARFGNCRAAMDEPRAGPASHQRCAAGPAAHDSGAGLYVTDLDTPRGALMGHAARPSRHAAKLPCHATRSRSIQKPPNRTTA